MSPKPKKSKKNKIHKGDSSQKAVADNQSGLPNKQQLGIMLKRYASVQFFPVDVDSDGSNNNSEGSSDDSKSKTITIQSDTAKFKKPIFLDADTGKMDQKIIMALKEQGSHPNENAPDPNKIALAGNQSLVQRAMEAHNKLIGDDPYNPNHPYENDIELVEGSDIPEKELEKIDTSNNNKDNDPID